MPRLGFVDVEHSGTTITCVQFGRIVIPIPLWVLGHFSILTVGFLFGYAGSVTGVVGLEVAGIIISILGATIFPVGLVILVVMGVRHLVRYIKEVNDAFRSGQ